MTEGTTTYDGLAVPLSGESEIKQVDITKDILTLTSYTSNTSDFLVLQDVDNTEILRIEDNGRIWQSISAAAGDSMAIYHTLIETTTASAQSYAGTFFLDEATFGPGNGRNATLNVHFDCSGVGAAAARSYINFDDRGSSMTTFFVVHASPDDGGVLEATTSTATHGLVCYFDNTKYWILCTDSS